MIAMLEDEVDRLRRFKQILSDHFPSHVLHHWRTAHDFVAGYANLNESPQLICLDHDLFCLGGRRT